MAEDRTLHCRCGAMRWRIADDARGTHAACYCADCQTFARHLGAGDDWLDAEGGTEVFQTVPHNLAFLAGEENLALLRLSPKGMLRWHSACCGTPIANTLASPGLPFVGVVLPPGATGFGQVSARVNTGSARQLVRQSGTFGMVLGVLLRAIGARLMRRPRLAPFFRQDGSPVRAARILSAAERQAARPG